MAKKKRLTLRQMIESFGDRLFTLRMDVEYVRAEIDLLMQIIDEKKSSSVNTKKYNALDQLYNELLTLEQTLEDAESESEIKVPKMKELDQEW